MSQCLTWDWCLPLAQAETICGHFILRLLPQVLLNTSCSGPCAQAAWRNPYVPAGLENWGSSWTMLQWEAAAALPPLLLFPQVDRARTHTGAWHYINNPSCSVTMPSDGYGSVSLVSSAQNKLWSKSPLMAFCDLRETLVQCSVLYFLGKN